MKKKILIYGDSNLWSFDTINNKRLEEKERWSNMIQEYLKDKYLVIPEGCPGRTAGNYNNEKIYKNGKDTFEAIFRSHAPIDYIIIALGSNDLQSSYNNTSKNIYNDLIWYKEKIKSIYNIKEYKERFFNQTMPKFIYLLPPNFDEKNIFNENSEIKRKELIKDFKSYCNDTYIEINNVDLSDGLHFSKEGQEMVFNKVKELFE